MPDALADPTIVENLIGALLISGPSKVEPGIRVLFSHEPIPVPQADDGTDTPIVRWCRMNPVDIRGLVRRNGSGDVDQQALVMTITVGVSDTEVVTSPARLSQSMMLIAAALDGQTTNHDSTTHSVQIHRVNRAAQSGGSHAGSQIGVLTLSGLVSRTSGRTASLSS